MDILNVKVEKIEVLEGKGELKAYADLTFGDLFRVNDFRIMEGKEGLFIDMPTSQREHTCGVCGSITKNVFVPSTEEMKAYLKEVIFDAYANITEE